jgi:hypothetical protein
MKKLFICCMASVALLSACKKEAKVTQNPVEAKVKHAVNLNVSGFKQSVENFKSAVTSRKMMSANSMQASPTGMYFFYAAYNESGVEVSRRMAGPGGDLLKPSVYPYGNMDDAAYTFTTGNPGNFTDSLTAGNYTVVFVAAETEIALNWRLNNDEIHVQPLSNAYFMYTRPLDSWSRSSNTYFKKIPITVGQSNNEVDVVMNRIVGRVEINIEDAIPANASYFTFLFDNEQDQFNFNTETSGGLTNDVYLHDEDHITFPFSSPITPQQIGQNNYKFNKYIINTSTPVSVIINCYDATNNIIATKTIANVQVYKNKRTLLTGKLFTPNIPESAFSVTVDEEWNTETDTVNF